MLYKRLDESNQSIMKLSRTLLRALLLTLASSLIDGATITSAIVGTGVYSKEYGMSFDAIESCEKSSTSDIVFDLKLNKVSRNVQYLYGNITYKIPWDETLTMKSKVSQRGKGDWKAGAFYMNVQGCTAVLKLLGKAYLALAATSRDIPTKCPIPKGVYRLVDVDTSAFGKMNLPPLMTGHWRTHVTYVHKPSKRVVGCVTFYVNLAPKS